MELYVEVFEQQDALKHLEAFASYNGPDFYGLPRNSDQIKITKKAWALPEKIDYLGETITPLYGGQQLSWSVI